MRTSSILFLLPLLAAYTAAFIAPDRRVVPTINNGATSCSTPMRSGHGVTWSPRMAASDGGGDEDTTSTPPIRRRRKRKDGNRFPPPSLAMSDTTSNVASTLTDTPGETPTARSGGSSPNADVLVMRVRDIRDVVSGGAAPPESPSFDGGDRKDDAAGGGGNVDDDDDDEGDDELADDEEWEYYDVDDDGREIVPSSSSGGERRPEAADGDARRPPDDAIDRLLADARRMRAASAGGQSTQTTQTKTRGVKETTFEVISAIVTVDFFVVLALLAWFLAGIFCSYILKDDAVQIAFNMNFERLTQP
ncbi:hypothetical protein ACHAW5_001300 [Stephanodiscus triporus]|uniref:Uncharacterized protein n=1 Tax=Stephanodiscus triporus TaxID=2934178 RepID=A0ABD3NHP8_9STRA